MRRRRELGRRKDLVALQIGGTGYFIPIDVVRELLRPRETVAVAGGGGEVLGVADYRDEVLPVVDLRLVLKVASPESRESMWIVVDHGPGPVALVVDKVVAVIAGDREPAPEGGSNHVVRYDDRVFFPLDLGPALTRGAAVHHALVESLGRR